MTKSRYISKWPPNMGQGTHHIQRMELNELSQIQQMVQTISKSFSMEVGYMTTDVKNKRIKIVGKNRFTALHLFSAAAAVKVKQKQKKEAILDLASVTAAAKQARVIYLCPDCNDDLVLDSTYQIKNPLQEVKARVTFVVYVIKHLTILLSGCRRSLEQPHQPYATQGQGITSPYSNLG